MPYRTINAIINVLLYYINSKAPLMLLIRIANIYCTLVYMISFSPPILSPNIIYSLDILRNRSIPGLKDLLRAM